MTNSTEANFLGPQGGDALPAGVKGSVDSATLPGAMLESTQHSGFIRVGYESEWDEGTVTTSAYLDLGSGEIVGIIPSSDPGDEDLGRLLCEKVTDLINGFTAMVEGLPNGRYFLKERAQVACFDSSGRVSLEQALGAVPADMDPRFHAQTAALRQVTASINASFGYQPPGQTGNAPAINVTLQAGVLTMPDGSCFDLTAVQAAMNFGFQETGDPALMEACDTLAKITGMEQGPHGQFEPSQMQKGHEPKARGSSPADRYVLAQMDEHALADEIRRRGRLVTVWSPDDLEFIGNEDPAAQDLSQEELDQIQQLAFSDLKKSLESVTTARGNDFLADWWEGNKTSFLPRTGDSSRETMR